MSNIVIFLTAFAVFFVLSRVVNYFLVTYTYSQIERAFEKISKASLYRENGYIIFMSIRGKVNIEDNFTNKKIIVWMYLASNRKMSHFFPQLAGWIYGKERFISDI